MKDGVDIPKIGVLVNQSKDKINKTLDDINSITGEMNKLVVKNSERVDQTLLMLADQAALILTEASKATKNIIATLTKKTEPIFDDSQKAIRTVLRDLTRTLGAISGSMENNMTASLKDIRVILQNVRLLTARVNSLMDQVEQMPNFSQQKRKRSVIIDEAEREDY